MQMIFDEYKGKTVIVSGAASGMGLLCAKRFAENGAHVVMVDCNRDAVETAAEDLHKEGLSVQAEQADVRFYAEVEGVVQKTLSSRDNVDILVNFAGGNAPRIWKSSNYFPQLDPEIIDWGIDVNLKGPIHFARAVLPIMIRQKGGTIINIGSTAGTAGHESLDYSTAKSGIMNGLTKSLAIYGAKYGVRCCCVTPGPVLTRPEMANMATLLGYAAEPWEVVDFVLYLCSDHGRSMTGAEYIIDGGRSATVMDTVACEAPSGSK